jgi:hypothetical protein
MSDRAILEMAEARILVASYFAAKRTYGGTQANSFLIKQLKSLEKLYDKDSGDRLRANMRTVADEELLIDT